MPCICMTECPIPQGLLLKEKTHEKIKEPSLYKVILLNDDYTTMEFVVEILMIVFFETIRRRTLNIQY